MIKNSSVFLLVMVIFSILVNHGIFLLDRTMFPIEKVVFDLSSPILIGVYDLLNWLLGYELLGVMLVLGVLYLMIIPSNIYAKFFLLISPFIYERLITQPTIILSTVLLLYSINWMKNNKMISSSLLFAIARMAMPHAIVMIGLIYILRSIFFLRTFSQIKKLLLSGLVIFGLNANRLIGTLFLGSNTTLEYTNTIDHANIEAFQITNLDGLGAELTGLLQYGFRGERGGHVLVPGEVYQYRWIAGAIVVLVCMIGWGFLIRDPKTRRWGCFVVSLGLISRVLGVGVGSPIRDDMTRWMYDNIPLYKGMRDSQKWIGLLMIAQLFGWVKFRTVLLQYVKSFDLSVWKQRTISAFFFLVSLVLLHIRNPHMPHAMRQQVLWTTWPEEYFQLKEHLKTFETDGDIVIMPRHSYLVCEWTHTKRQKKTVPLVLDRFTGDERLIKSDNIEAFQLYSNSTNPRSADIEARRKDMQDYKLLTKNDISHVLLIDDCSFDREKEELITAFENDEKLEKVRHEGALRLYEIRD